MADELPGAEALPVRLAARGEAADDSPARSYADAEKSTSGPVVSHFLPTRLIGVALSALAALAMVGGCLALHAASAALSTQMPAADVTALRLDRRDSIADWLASMLLVASGAVALLVYSLRRHRLDDYHGRYRVWLWLCAACLAASLVETTEIDSLARGLSGLAAAWANITNSVLWPAIVGIVVGGVGLRLFFEIRHCRWALTALAGSVLAFAFAAAASHAWLIVLSSASLPYWARGSWLVGYVLILTTFLLYGRHVQLEAAGTIAVRKRKKRKHQETPASEDSQPETAHKPALRLRTDLDPVERAKDTPTAHSQATLARSKAAEREEHSAAEEREIHLSRAERRRLRRDRMAS